MIDIDNLTLGQLEELQDKVQIRIEYLKKEIPEVNIGDCFVSTGFTYICFCKVKNIENDSYEVEFIAYDFIC